MRTVVAAPDTRLGRRQSGHLPRGCGEHPIRAGRVAVGRQRSSGGLAGVFSHFEVWVLSEPERRAAFVMANRVFDDRDACEASKAELSAAISARLGTPDFPHAASVEEAPREGTEYVFACHSPVGTDAVLLNFVVRSAEMSREFDRISQQKLKKFNRRAE